MVVDSFLLCGVVRAQPTVVGVNTQGNTGGLVIPYAAVRTEGDLVVTAGDYLEPQFGPYTTRQNFSLGLGLFPNVELYGRVTNYVNTTPGVLFEGLRDLSANVKLLLPDFWEGGPRLAVGINDISGGAVLFKSDYLVASKGWGPLSVTMGYATGKSAYRQSFDGLFGGVALKVPGTGLSVLAEYDGLQKHVGARWQSAPIASLGHVQLLGTLQRSVDAKTFGGSASDTTNMALTMVMPFGGQVKRREASVKAALVTAPVRLSEAEQPSKVVVTEPDASAQDAVLVKLRRALTGLGLERVRVGQRDSALGKVWVAEYENHRYAHNEVDAIGIVLGVAAQLALPDVQRVQAVTLKNGMPLYETSVNAAAYRSFLRGESASQVLDGLVWDWVAGKPKGETQWQDSRREAAALVRLEIKPDLKYTLGTEVGLFDYALAASVQATAPLWPGAKIAASYIVPVGNTQNIDIGGAFSILKQRQGLKSVTFGQTYGFGQHIAHLDVGRFHYDVNGVQLQSLFLIPNSGDTLRVRGAAYDRAPRGLAGAETGLGAISYRHQWNPGTWLEAGVQRYSDGSSGPTLEWTRWFEDFSAQLYFRQGGNTRFAGLQLSFPLTPRQGMKPNALFVTGASHYDQGLRTFLTNANQPANFVSPGSVQDLRLETSLDVDMLNRGRLSQKYMATQLARMRDAFATYALKAAD